VTNSGWWYLSGPFATVAVKIEYRGSQYYVTDGPPIVQKFIGQRARNLYRWLKVERAEQLSRPQGLTG